MMSAMLALLPGRKYFTVDALYAELEKANLNAGKKHQKAIKKQKQDKKKK